MSAITIPTRITLQVTVRCDKGCRICFADSRLRGPSLPFATISEITRQLPPNATVGITGGEPFLYQDGAYDLADVVRQLDPTKRKIGIITSGWVPGEEPYETVFAKLAPYMPGVQLGTSFNLYQKKGIEQRVPALLARVLQHGGSPWVNVVVSRATAVTTLNRLTRILGEMGFSPGRQHFVESLMETGRFEDIRFCSSTGQTITVVPMPLQASGRGKRVVEARFTVTEGCGFLRGANRMSISTNGDVYPCESPSVMDGPGLGNATEESLARIYSRFDACRQGLLKVMAEKPEDVAVCEACAAARANGLEGFR